jgi:phosphopantetheinyl transferase
MIFLLNESFPAGIGATRGSIELFAAACNHQERAAVLREWLGHEYRADPHGRPVSERGSISISHTPGLLVLAVRAGGRIGVDVESIPGSGDLALLPQGVSLGERQQLLLLPLAERALAFTQLWTTKEALSKAFGLGHSMDLSQIEVRVEDQGVRFISLYEKPELAAGWTVAHRRLEVPAPAVIGVAWDQVVRQA